jgi:histone H3/H4
MSFHAVVLESAVHRTLHAHGFSRSSTQASLVMTDLLSRYMTLLSSTCAKYAQHAGRTSPTAFDAIDALDELGVDLDELGQYCVSEARELGHYALFTARRVEDLNEIKCQFRVRACAVCSYVLASPTRRRTQKGKGRRRPPCLRACVRRRSLGRER